MEGQRERGSLWRSKNRELEWDREAQAFILQLYFHCLSSRVGIDGLPSGWEGRCKMSNTWGRLAVGGYV